MPNSPPGASAVDQVRDWVDDAARIVVLTGAGISTESGIPDFRGPQGVWTKNPQAEKLSNIHYYMSDPEVRKASWKSRLDHPAWTAQPNAGHLALAALEKRGKLHALITQNIDELHQMAGNSPDKVIEVHGTVRKVVCMACGMVAPMQKALDRVRAGEDDPPCRDCGGILKSATISFGQPLVPEVIDRALALRSGSGPVPRDRHQPAGLPDRGRRGKGERRRREDRDRQRRGDSVRRHRGCGDTPSDRRGAAAAPRIVTRTDRSASRAASGDELDSIFRDVLVTREPA